MKIYNSFYPNLLWKVFIDLLTNQVNKLLPLVSINKKEKEKLKNILEVKNY